MVSSYYDKSQARHINKLSDLAPDQAKAMEAFNSGIFKEGALSKKEKEIIAVAIAHVTQCPYCIVSMHIPKMPKKKGLHLRNW